MEDLTSVKETAEEWIARVREALKGGSQSTVDDLRALLSEAKHIPVLMHERALLEAEVDARSWAIKCGKMLESRARADAVRASLKELQKIKHTLPAAQRKVGGMVPYAARWGVSCSLVVCVLCAQHLRVSEERTAVTALKAVEDWTKSAKRAFAKRLPVRHLECCRGLAVAASLPLRCGACVVCAACQGGAPAGAMQQPAAATRVPRHKVGRQRGGNTRVAGRHQGGCRWNTSWYFAVPA